MLRILHSVLGFDLERTPDGVLLERFVRDRDEQAFTTLLRRHSPMVLAVCRKITGHTQDAEDAFQATFLVLARKASSVRPSSNVGNWLFGVASRTARKARSRAIRIRSRETESLEQVEAMAPVFPADDRSAVILEEVERLPDSHRVPLVLCDLEDRPRKEVARELGIPEGTLSSRLTAARSRLAARLARRDITVPTAAVGPLLSSSVVTAGLGSEALVGPAVRNAVAFASGIATTISGPVVELVHQVLCDRVLPRVAILTACSLSILGASVVAAVLASGNPDDGDPEVAPPRPVVADVAPTRGAVVAEPLRRVFESSEWIVTGIDQAKRTVNLSEPTGDRPDARALVLNNKQLVPGGFSLRSVPLAPSAEIREGGKPLPLERLSIGQRVRVGFEPGKLRVTRLDATVPRPPEFLYRVTALDPRRRTISVEMDRTRGKLENLPFTARSKIELYRPVRHLDGYTIQMREGKLSDLEVGKSISLDLRVTPEGRVEIARVCVGN